MITLRDLLKIAKTSVVIMKGVFRLGSVSSTSLLHDIDFLSERMLDEVIEEIRADEGEIKVWIDNKEDEK